MKRKDVGKDEESFPKTRKEGERERERWKSYVFVWLWLQCGERPLLLFLPPVFEVLPLFHSFFSSLSLSLSLFPTCTFNPHKAHNYSISHLSLLLSFLPRIAFVKPNRIITNDEILNTDSDSYRSINFWKPAFLTIDSSLK